MAKSTTDAVCGASNQWLWSRVKPSVLTNVSPTAELLSSAIEWLRVNGPLKVCRFFPPSTACSPGPARDATAARSVGFRSTRAFRFLLARPAYRIRTAAVVRRAASVKRTKTPAGRGSSACLPVVRTFTRRRRFSVRGSRMISYRITRKYS